MISRAREDSEVVMKFTMTYPLIQSMDWFSRENLQETMVIFPLNIGFSCKFSLKPIHGSSNHLLIIQLKKLHCSVRCPHVSFSPPSCGSILPPVSAKLGAIFFGEVTESPISLNMEVSIGGTPIYDRFMMENHGKLYDKSGNLLR